VWAEKRCIAASTGGLRLTGALPFLFEMFTETMWRPFLLFIATAAVFSVAHLANGRGVLVYSGLCV